MYKLSESSSWKLKEGLRSTAPGGKFDGNFEEDFEYIANSGSLDECNGKKINGFILSINCLVRVSQLWTLMIIH